METLAPRASYDSSRAEVGERLPISSGGVLHSAVEALGRLERVRGRMPTPVRVVVSALAGGMSGIIFNVVLPHTVLWWDRRVTDQLYAGDARMLPPPPSAGYTYRLPCARMAAPDYAVGGVLYLGARGVRFDPHLRNRRRDRDSLVVEPLAGVRAELVDAALPRWVWWRRSVPRIRLHWPAGHADFAVPDAPAVHVLLAQHLARFQRPPPQGRPQPRSTSP
jgi:hypothetical protein